MINDGAVTSHLAATRASRTLLSVVVNVVSVMRECTARSERRTSAAVPFDRAHNSAALLCVCVCCVCTVHVCICEQHTSASFRRRVHAHARTQHNDFDLQNCFSFSAIAAGLIALVYASRTFAVVMLVMRWSCVVYAWCEHNASVCEL